MSPELLSPELPAEYPKTAAYLDAIYARPSIAGPHGHFEKIYARVAV